MLPSNVSMIDMAVSGGYNNLHTDEGAAIMSKTKQDFLSLLQVSDKLHKDRQVGLLDQRIVALGHGVVCSRCSGSGHYSFNLVNGTTCFKCHGSGQLPPKLTNKLYAALEADVISGKLEVYFAEVRGRLAAERAVNNASELVMNAWQASGVSKAYSWQLAAQQIQPHRQIADEVNRPMCEAYERVQKAVSAVSSLQFKLKRASDKAQSDDLKAQINESITSVLLVRDEALEVIKQASLRLEAIMAEKP